jgi:Gpi18-like mannosyltransferase
MLSVINKSKGILLCPFFRFAHDRLEVSFFLLLSRFIYIFLLNIILIIGNDMNLLIEPLV